MATDKHDETPVKGTDDPVIRPFADWLREQSKGKTHDEMSVALHDLIGRVIDTGKKGVSRCND
jgi:hypothetical protein